MVDVCECNTSECVELAEGSCSCECNERNAEWNEENSGLLTHAKREFELAGYDLNQTEEDPNKWIVENVLELLRVFAKQGHSGGSAPWCINYFAKLAKYELLTPLTAENVGWVEVAEGVFQSSRYSSVFKDKDGSIYDIDGKVFIDENNCYYTSKESRVPVSFPYIPKTEYVHVKGE